MTEATTPEGFPASGTDDSGLCVLIVSMKAKPGLDDALEQQLRSQVPTTRAEPEISVLYPPSRPPQSRHPRVRRDL